MRVRDYYVVLGVPRTESAGGIREAFRHLALRYHPDRAGATSTPLFQEIVEAYRVLGDPQKRALYDRALRHAERSAEVPSPAIVTGSPPVESLAPVPVSILGDFEIIRPSLEALLDRVRRNFTGRGVPKAERLQALNVEIVLTPEEAARGGLVEVGIPVYYPCPQCHGVGRRWIYVCDACSGVGMVEEEEPVRVRLPPLVADGDVLEMPLRGLGIHNLFLRLVVRLAPG
jgi:molecular chaperone DnaJ